MDGPIVAELVGLMLQSLSSQPISFSSLIFKSDTESLEVFEIDYQILEI